MSFGKSISSKFKYIVNDINYLIALKTRPSTVNHYFAIDNLELTNKCPMKCTMCVRTHRMTRPQGFMEMDIFKKIIDEIVMINPPFIYHDGFWLHHFGESLLHPNFDKMIKYCSSRGIKAKLSLNPLMLTEDISRRLINAEPSLLFFAMDGHDDESFYKIRGIPKAFNKSKDNVIRFLKLKKSSSSNVRVVISMINFTKNMQSIKEMYSFWKQQEGIEDVHLKPFTDWNGEVREITNMTGSDVNGVAAINKNQKTKGPVECRIPWQMISITWDGDVVPCCYDYDKKYVLGNVKNNTLQQIWNGDRIKDLRNELRSNIVENELCRSCLHLSSLSSRLE